MITPRAVTNCMIASPRIGRSAASLLDQVGVNLLDMGFADPQGLRRGVDGIIAQRQRVGTRFCATVEAPIHDRVKQFLVANDERATNLIFRQFRNTGRVARNSVSDQVLEISARPDATFDDIRSLVSGAQGRLALETGNLDAGLIWAGQVQGLIRDLPSCADLIGRIVREAERIIQGRLIGMVASDR